MGKKYRRYRNFIEKYLASEKGKRFFHVAYCVGAAIVILGALFKINHYAYGGTILFIGLVTEAIIFFLSAFDAPAKEYKWEQVYPILGETPKRRSSDEENTDTENTPTGTRIQGAGGTVIIGGGNASTGNLAAASTGGIGGVITGGTTGAALADPTNMAEASEKYTEQLSKLTESMEKFAEITASLTHVSDTLLTSFKSITDNSEGIGTNTMGYVTQMESLNRNLSGLNTIYEVQLKGISGQIHTIEQINAGLDRIKKLYDGSLADSSIFKNETEKMAVQLAELNRVYARMLQAMTVNMNMGMGGFGSGMQDTK